MKLNSAQIERLIRHACDKNKADYLSGGITFCFVEVDKDVNSAVVCDYNGFEYKPVIKFYSGFSKLNYNQQIKEVLRSTCEAIYEHGIKELQKRPIKHAVTRMFNKCIKQEIKNENL